MAAFQGGLEFLAALAFLEGEKAAKSEGVWRKSRENKGRRDGGGSGEDLVGDLVLDAGSEKSVAGIGEAGGACIGDDGDAGAALGAGNQVRGAALFIMVM